MIAAIFYKEWLKVRFPVLLTSLALLLFLIKIFFSVAYEMRLNDASSYWYMVVFRRMIFYSWLNYVPVLIGLIVGFAQFSPEVTAKRLKLTLHLPENEYKIITTMTGFGVLVLSAMFLTTIGLLGMIVLHYFPIEVFSSVWITVLPWFLAGLASYLFTAAIFTEPVWRQRVIMIIFTLGVLYIMLGFDQRGTYEAYAPVTLHLFVMVLISGLTEFISVARFRKGVQ